MKSKKYDKNQKEGLFFNTPNNTMFPRENKRRFRLTEITSSGLFLLLPGFSAAGDDSIPLLQAYNAWEKYKHPPTGQSVFNQSHPSKPVKISEKRATRKLSHFTVSFARLITDLWNSVPVSFL